VSDINYSKLRFLIADDFSNFRATVITMLGKLGICQIDTANNGADVLDKCQRRTYDVILCDYDLGPGRNGQQVLEELRFKSLLPRHSLFVLVSADAAKDLVMAAYDCEPDDYLMKPITAQMLEQRVTRLLRRRHAMSGVYSALDADDRRRAMAFLIDLSTSDNRHARVAQKMLGEIFIAEGELHKAERLYTKVLELRPVDWARLGLARVKHLKGELAVAGDWLEKIVLDNPLYLPAYDVLANNWEQLGENQQVQAAVQRSVAISPKSILRQKRLAQVAERNGDLGTSLQAFRSTVRLGALSCHACPEDGFQFARVAASSLEKKMQPAEPLVQEVVEVMSTTRQRFTLSREQITRAELLTARLLAYGGNVERAKSLVEVTENQLRHASEVPLDVDMERVQALQALGEHDQADSLLRELLQRYAYDQSALEKLDTLLAEPVSETNRAMIATVNREGIDLYNQARFDEAIECFEKVRRIFPRHVGVHLNIVQSLIGKLRAGQKDVETISTTERALATIGSLIEPDHSQYARFQRLQDMATVSMAR
jgi:tetratricopeptide (TPR) repeat protein